VGRNGEGKSSKRVIHILERVFEFFSSVKALLKATSDRLIPGIPDNLRILLVSQVDEKDELSMLAGEHAAVQRDPNLTVTERVVKSDQRREKALMEQDCLSKFHQLR
jgi:hypothetical protein